MNMKKNNFVMVISALALIFVMVGLSGCASTHEKLIQGVPEDQWVRLFLAGKDRQLTKVDGQKMGKNPLNPFDQRTPGGRYGTGNTGTIGAYRRDTEEMTISATLPPGEHTITVKYHGGYTPKKKEFSTTFNFEAGKFYLVELTTDPSLSLADSAKAELIDDYIIIITERNLSPFAYGEKDY
jgi:hypothetical protein